MRCILTVALVALCCTPAFLQDFNHYRTVQSQGPVPKDFTDRSAAKYAQELTNMTHDKEETRRERKGRKKFYLESTFNLDEFLGSGNVLFNDEISTYTNSVLQEVLKPYPALQSKLRVYTVKSPVTNAFTTNNGIVFVNLGLLARLENEAQLAFVLGHEATHYEKKHVINSYVNNVVIEESRDYRKLSSSDKAFAKSSYSRELETEADQGAIDIYIRSAYSKDSVGSIFDVLRNGDHPIFWTRFDKRTFESARYIFPDTLVAKSVKSTYPQEDNDDELSTHPDVRKRKRIVARKFRDGGPGDLYRVSKTGFEKVRKMARFELCRLYLLEHLYFDALALAISLQEQDPTSVYLKETVAKALYGLAKAKLADDEYQRQENWASTEAYLAEFFSRQTAYETSVTAMRELNKCLEAAPENKEIALMLSDIIRSLAAEQDDLEESFLRTATEKEIPELEYPYTQYAFLDFKDNDEFFERFDKQIAIVRKEIAESKKITRKKKKIKVKEKPLDVNKIVVVNPIYKKIDTRKKQRVRHIEAEEVMLDIDEKIGVAAGRLDLSSEVINPNNVTSGSIRTMQANSILNDWIDEQMRSEKLQVSPIYNEITALADSYKTDHFVWMGGISVTRKRRGKVWLVIASAAAPPAAPLLIPLVFTPKGRSMYFSLVFNVRTQALEVVDVRAMSVRDNANILQSNIYYTLLKLKKTKVKV
ncbi:M48 family metallopeptidase [Dawidia soli]|uniref:M48 family metalloprotease n=1 Tax=Dawidia soli TaxID=2782352 RepID=A0AAP2D5W7_9BACT|nr:M48 family metallopeptidase [Dawidia soli]MBT1685936.1 M48 family metalloprotease [Dawidia soli]